MKRKTMVGKVLIILLGVLGMLWFAIPYLYFRILNIGNATGLAVFLLILLYGVFQKSIHKFIRTRWKNKFGRILLVLIAAMATCTLCFVIIISAFMIHSINQKPKTEATLIVLGCKVCGERPSIVLKERIDRAYTYLNKNENAVAILSGGQGIGENISEAECMFQELTAMGIEPDRLYKEDKSTSTRENLLFSKEIIKEHGMTETVAIVTNEFHEYRAMTIAGAIDLETSAISARTAWYMFPTYYVRELYGILYEWVF